MGMKNKIIYSMIVNLFDKGRRDPRWVKKIVAIGVMFGLLFVVSSGFLLYFAVGMAKDLVAGTPDMDLLAMERLLTEKPLALSAEQQRLLTPIIAALAVPDLAPEQVQALKTQLWASITPAQLDKIEAWKAETSAKASNLFALPPAAAIIENYTRLIQEVVVAGIDAFLAWWQLAKPAST